MVCMNTTSNNGHVHIFVLILGHMANEYLNHDYNFCIQNSITICFGALEPPIINW